MVEQLQLAYTTLNVFLLNFTFIILEENISHLHDFSSFNCAWLALFILTRMFEIRIALTGYMVWHVALNLVIYVSI